MSVRTHSPTPILKYGRGTLLRFYRFPDFRRFVLEKAQSEINELTDINMSFEPIKTGRKVTSIKFIIEEKFKNSRKRIRTSNEKRRL